MSNMYVEEFSHLAVDGNGMPIMAGRQPSIARQKFSFTGTPNVSAAFNVNTRFIRLHADGIYSYLVAADPSGVAVTDVRQVAGVTEYFAIDPSLVGTGLKVGAITNT